MDRTGAQAELFRLKSSRRRLTPVSHRLSDSQQAGSRTDDHLVAGAQVLLVATVDAAHRLRHGRVLQCDGGDAAERLRTLDLAVEQVVVASVSDRVPGAVRAARRRRVLRATPCTESEARLALVQFLI